VAQAIRLYLDEHVPRAVANGLRLRGVDVLTTAEAAMQAATDEAQLNFAVAQTRTIVTLDADYLRLHAAGAHHAGIIYGPQGMPIGDMIRGVMLVIELLADVEMVDHVEFL